MTEYPVLSAFQLDEALREQVHQCPANPRLHTRHVPDWDGSEHQRWHSSNEQQRLQKRKALWEIQQAYLRGYLDPARKRWCWQCYQRAKMLYIGSLIGYPGFPWVYLSEEPWPPSWWPAGASQECTGEVVWRAVAENCSHVIVEGIMRYHKEAYLEVRRARAKA